MIDRSTFVYLVHETPTFTIEVMRTLPDRLASSTGGADRTHRAELTTSGARFPGQVAGFRLIGRRYGTVPSSDPLDRLDVGWTQTLEGELDTIQTGIVDG